MIILVDMDGTIADWNYWIDNRADKYFPEALGRIPRAQEAVSFDLFADLGTEERRILLDLFNFDRLYRDIPPIEGAISAVNQMREEGHDVFFVSSPWFDNLTCMEDKVHWLRSHFSWGAENKLILTKDKTAVRGDILIDDKPEVVGQFDPEWVHVLFDQKYNSTVNKPRISSWKTWRSVLNSETLDSRNTVAV